MTKFLLVIFCVFALFAVGCGNSEDGKKEERRKNIMGSGDLKMPKKGDPIPGL